jgi:hypothetical protein
MLAAKSFQATSDWSAIRKWLAILAAELADRIATDTVANNRHPRNLVLHYRSSPACYRASPAHYIVISSLLTCDLHHGTVW